MVKRRFLGFMGKSKVLNVLNLHNNYNTKVRNMDYRNRLKNCKSLIVKVGTSTITYSSGKLNLRRIDQLARVLTDIRNRGINVVLVSSGAIGVGSVRLGFETRPTLMREKQAAAAVGQAVLMQIYQNIFNEYNQKTAQVLVTKEDMSGNERPENIVNTFHTLWEFGVIPVVNANDTISTAEIGFSDNDNLAAQLGAFLKVDTLVLCTDIDGMYNCDPKKNPDAVKFSVIDEITDEIQAMAGDKGSTFSVGGMSAKLTAAELCMENGIDMIVALGDDPYILYDIIDGKDVGTLFAGKR